MENRGFHHAYLGLAILMLGFGLIFTATPSWLCVLTVTLGAAIFIDDFYQHLVQRFDDDYRSPLNRWYGETLWRWSWVRKLNEWADKLFGRR